MRRIRVELLPGLLLALTLAIGACGGGGNSDGVASLGGDTPTTTSPGGGGDTPTSTTAAGGGGNDLTQQALAYARCMRQQGVDLPDPKFDAQGRMAMQLPAGVGPDDPKFKAADEACKQYLPNGGEPDKPDPQLQQQMLAFARCMRQHGINIPDPKPGGGIGVDGEAGVDPNSPKFKAAWRACQQYEPQGGDKQEQFQPSGGGGG